MRREGTPRRRVHPLLAAGLLIISAMNITHRLFWDIPDFVAIPILLCGMGLMFAGAFKYFQAKNSCT